MDTKQFFNIFFPGKLVFGNGCFEQLPEVISGLRPARVFIATIQALEQRVQSGIADHLAAEGIKVLIDTGIRQEPGFADFEQLMQRVKPFDPDIVLGIGGGSVLDIAKLVAAQLGNEQVLADYIGNGLLSGRDRKLICVPTTSGTGSEVSPNAILVDESDHQKKGIISPYLVPDMVFVDPLLTVSLPPAITAATGIDALTHCMEAYTNKFAQPFVDMMAYEGMRLIAAHIVRTVEQGDDVDARAQVAMGSLLGGFCLGPVNTAGVHALSYPLGSKFHLAHGLSNALLLPFVMEYNIPAAPSRYAAVARALGCTPAADDAATAARGVERVRELNRACGIPAGLRTLGIDAASIPELAREAMKVQRLLKNNPREITEKDAAAIFQTALG
ncbi:iron-containing alcohol dehydrogenase [Niabella terrae]